MNNILIIGAGRSSTFLIEYLIDFAEKNEFTITLADTDLELAKSKCKHSKIASPIQFNVDDEESRKNLINKAKIVVSMLPAHMHLSVANDCVTYKKHLVTASYVSAGMKLLHDEALANDVILLNEVGLDPGIDHMSAMKIIHELNSAGANITSFKSYCGGLVAPESNDNPWGYKFSWNPRNVILAGQSTAQYRENGTLKLVPYQRIFSTADSIEVDGYGSFDAYPNRDSLSYLKPYELENIQTMLRGTLRQQHYCKAWNVFVQLGICDDSYKIDTKNMSYRMLLDSFLPESNLTTEEKLKKYCDADQQCIEMLEYTGILSDVLIHKSNVSPAEILQALLEERWKLLPHDKDMVVMVHQFEYTLNGIRNSLQSSLVVKGDDSTYTAMAKTVGLPAAIAVKNILTGNIKLRGVQIPILPEVYEPILDELSHLGIVFEEQHATH
jgi:saccharopine dehydrogenase (NADP+, L-glutamate forming)